MSLLLSRPLSWRSLAALSFWFGVFQVVTGSLITFYPGAEVGFCAFAAIFILPGLLLSRSYRIGAILGLALLAWFSVSGYQRGIAYEQRQHERQWDD